MKTSPPRLVIVAQILGMLLALGWQSNVSATIVVGLIDHQHHRIVLAGDGKMTVWSRHGWEPHVSQHPTCKVFATRTCAFTINGIVGDRDTHFDVSKLALKACDFQGTLLVKADYFQTEALPMVVQMSEHAKRVLARKAFADLYERKDGFLDVTFAGMQDGRLSLITRGFEIGPRGVITKTQHLIQEADSGGSPILQIIGPDDAIVAYMHTHKDWVEKMDFAIAARVFIEQEIKDQAQTLGPPIAILEVEQSSMSTDPNRASVRWIERGACTDSDHH
jgi:hypothetical protein